MAHTDVRMVLGELEVKRAVPYPKSIRRRAFRRGDAEVWARIQNQTGVYPMMNADAFRREFASDADVLKERVFFLEHETSGPIATSAGWFDAESSRGRIHWVAVVPAWQGQGLGTMLVVDTCVLLWALGHSRIFLTTGRENLGAIRLYMRLGFRPDPRDTEEVEAWVRIGKALEAS